MGLTLFKHFGPWSGFPYCNLTPPLYTHTDSHNKIEMALSPSTWGITTSTRRKKHEINKKTHNILYRSSGFKWSVAKHISCCAIFNYVLWVPSQICNLILKKKKTKKNKKQSLHRTRDYHVRCLNVFGSTSNKVIKCMHASANNTHNL